MCLLLLTHHFRNKLFVSSIWFSRFKKFGGDERNRTADPLLARQVLSQLSYAPTFLLLSAKTCLVGLSGLEPLTSRLSGVRSNRLSYKPSVNSLSKYPRYFAMRFHHVLRTIYSCIHALAQASLRRACLPEQALLMAIVEIKGFEPLTPCLQGRCSPN